MLTPFSFYFNTYSISYAFRRLIQILLLIIITKRIHIFSDLFAGVFLGICVCGRRIYNSVKNCHFDQYYSDFQFDSGHSCCVVNGLIRLFFLNGSWSCHRNSRLDVNVIHNIQILLQ